MTHPRATRRRFLIGAAGMAGFGLTALAVRPGDRGAGGHGAYFETLSTSLRRAGIGRPTLIVDLDRLDANTRTVLAGVAPRAFRIVAKSLPSERLLTHIMESSGTNRLMVFHEPFIAATARAHPSSDLLVGKPMPVAAAAHFYSRERTSPFDPSTQLQWLIDSPERLRQYRELADGQGVSLRINVEIDVGLHRGGLAEPAELAGLLDAIERAPNLHFGGLMGYDPHVAKLPTALGLQEREFARVQSTYRGFLDAAQGRLAESQRGELLLNAAGSPTYRLWRGVDGIANDLSVGSGLVKPVDFDVPTLEGHAPALFVATPVLKASDGLRLPGLDGLGAAYQAWDRNRARTFFVYGGYWKATPVSPPGLATNPIFGRSTNQEMLNGSAKVELEVDDYVFLRPTQSEFVMLQFGDLAIVRGGKLVDFWSPFSQT